MTRSSPITMVIYLLLFTGTAYGQDPPDSNTHKAEGPERATWRFEIDNDVLFHKDNQIYSGWSVQKHSAAAWLEIPLKSRCPPRLAHLGMMEFDQEEIAILEGSACVERM